MGTRGLVGFVIDKTEKLSYNHYDSYPSELGAATLVWLKGNLTSANRLKPEAMQAIKSLQMVDEDANPTERQVADLLRFYDPNVGNRSESPVWYQVLRRCQGDLHKTLEAGYALDSHEFALDSSFCEWAYVVDVDAEKLDVYTGYTSRASGRWASRGRSPDGSFPIQRILSVPFADAATMDVEYFVKTATVASSS